jgi:hypothetical protein
MVHEKNLLGVQLSETSDGNIIWKKHEKRGLPCPVAIVIGHHPAFFIGSLCFSTLDIDEIRVAGGMLQRPVPLVRCKTTSLRRGKERRVRLVPCSTAGPRSTPDIISEDQLRRYVPRADVSRCNNMKPKLLNHLVSAHAQRGRQVQHSAG